MKTPLIIDNTILACWRSCKRKWFYTHVKHLCLKEKAPPLNYGIAIHKGIAHYILHGQNRSNFGESLEAALVDYPKIVNEKEWRTPEKLVDTLTHYFLDTKPFFPIKIGDSLVVEKEFALPLISKEERDSFGTLLDALEFDTIIYVGLIDLLAEHNSLKVVVDHKTTSGLEGTKDTGKFIPSNFWRSFKPHAATTGYLWGVNSLFGGFNGVVINAVGSNKYGYAFGSNLYIYTPEEIEEWRQNTIFTVKDMLHYMLDGMEDKQWNSDACFNYNSACEFLEVCNCPLNIRSEVIKSFETRVWNPLQEGKERR